MRLEEFETVEGIVAGQTSVDVAVIFRHRTRQLDAVRRHHVFLERSLVPES